MTAANVLKFMTDKQWHRQKKPNCYKEPFARELQKMLQLKPSEKLSETKVKKFMRFFNDLDIENNPAYDAQFFLKTTILINDETKTDNSNYRRKWFI